jgi:four helix bundle protein
MDFVEKVYRETAGWPADERFGLTSLVRRSVVSVPASIAEGSGRTGSAEMKHFLSIAHGSLCEVQTLLEIARRLGILAPEVSDELFADAPEVGRLIGGFIRKLSAV